VLSEAYFGVWGHRGHADADELIVAHQAPGTEAKLRSAELLGQIALGQG